MKEGEICYLVGLVFKISFCYDMLCCHHFQRGRLLDSVVLDVTQMSYQSLVLVHRVQIVITELTRSSKKIKQTVLTELTRSSKKIK